MAQRDLIVSFLSSVPPSVLALYMVKPLQLVCPVTQGGGGGFPGGSAGYLQWLNQYRDGSGNVIPGMFSASGASAGDTVGRVCVMGFSNGCIGIYHVLNAADSNQIDTVLAIDGIHGRYSPPGTNRLNGPSYKPYLNHAAQLVQYNPDFDENAPVMAVTHSRIVPPGYPSTTETADFIWDLVWPHTPEDVLQQDCGFDCPPAINEKALSDVKWTGGKRVYSRPMKRYYTWSGLADGWYDRRIANGLYVLGWGDTKKGRVTTKDPSGNADHIFQGRVVLRELLKRFTVARWNAKCGKVAVAGLGDSGAAGCVPGKGMVYGGAAGSKNDYFPDLKSSPPPQQCPAPAPGYVIVGGPGGACTTAPKKPPTKMPKVPPATQPLVEAPRPVEVLTDMAKVAFFVAAGYVAARVITSRLRRT